MNYSDKPWIKKYDGEVPEIIKIPNISLVDLFNRSVRANKNSVCTIFKDQVYTYSEIEELSNRVAAYLISKGIQKGDRVGISLPNTATFVIYYYGILKTGGVVMALNPAYRPNEVQSLAAESGIKILILSTEFYQEIKAVQDQTAIESMIVVGREDEHLLSPDILSKDVLDEVLERPVSIDVGPDDPAVFQYSGGTTGEPKCAVGLHRNLVANVYQFDQWLVNTNPGEETVLVAIPAYHVYGMVLGMHLAIKMGARMVLVSNPGDLDSLLKAIEKHHVTVFPGVPNLYDAINRYPPVLEGRYDLSSIKACISGSATLPVSVKQEFETLTHGHLVEGYGLSEAPTATHCNPILGENREGSIGLPLPNVDCRVVDIETGQHKVPVGEIGELIIHGPQVMAGYHQKPEETALAIREGWLYTGDIVRMDSEGYFYLVDRKKDVIKVGGFQVWPNEVEAVILLHPKVREVAVAGVINHRGAEVVKAWIVPQPDTNCTEDEIKTYCAEFLTKYKIPKFVSFRESLPRTRVGKILRRVLVAEDKQANQ